MIQLRELDPAPTNAELVRKGRYYMRAGRHGDAVSLLLPHSGERDRGGALTAMLAEAYEGLGDKHRARLLWLEVARHNRSGGRHQWRLGRQAFERGDHAEAEQLIVDYLEVAPGDLAAGELLLEIRLARAGSANRRAIYDRHVEQWPKTSYVLAVLAIEVVRSESRTEALAVLAWASSRWEGGLSSALKIAEAYALLREAARALPLLQRAIDVHPASVGLLRTLLRAQQDMSAPRAELMTTVDRLVALEPDEAGHHVIRARLMADFRDWAGSAASFQRALDLNRSVVGHWRGLLVALGNLERDVAIAALMSEAREYFGSQGPNGLIQLARLEMTCGDYQRAATLAAGAMANPSTRNRARDVAAAALLDGGHYTRAWSYLSTSIQDGQAGLVALRMSARCGAALRIPDPGAGVPSFPGALFERALLSPPTRSLIEPTDTVILVTSSLGAGGAERQVALTAGGVARARGHAKATVLVGQDLTPDRGRAVMRSVAETPELLIEDLNPVEEATVFRAIAAADPGARDALRLIAAMPPKLARNILKLYDCFRRHRPGLVHLWQDGVISAGSVAAVLAGVPRIVASMRNVVATEADRRRYRPYLRTMYQALLLRPEACLTANSAAGAADYERWLGLDSGAIKVLRNGLETDTVRARAPDAARKAARESLGVAADDLLVGGTFRLAPAKRPHLWLAVAEAVAARVPNSRFVIVGDGVLRHELDEWIVARGLSSRVTLAGRKSPVEPWIGAMDAMLLASEVEGLPNVLLEAQALGVPVVTTKAGGSGEAVLDGVTGYLVENDHPDALAAALSQLLTNHQMRGRAHVGAPAFIEQRFGLQRMLSDTLAVYGGQPRPQEDHL